tara:strand:- start:156 stop:1736 length:1581 start_codon:yes stop_codon:yes gene_type:complete
MTVFPEGNTSEWIVMSFKAAAPVSFSECQVGATISDTVDNLKTQIDSDPSFTALYSTVKIGTDTIEVTCLLERYFNLDFEDLSTRAVFDIENQLISEAPDTLPTTPYFQVSESNSVVLAYVEDYDSIAIYKNTFNSKAVQSDESVVECVENQFQVLDNIRTQFWSNYANISATQNYIDKTTQNIPIDLMVQNIGVQQTMDCVVVNVSGKGYLGNVGVFFESGNYYDYGTDNPNGEDYELNGLLPEWGDTGNYMFVSNYGWLEISQVVYDAENDANLLIADTFYGYGGDAIVSTQFNRHNYNVYEFALDLTNSNLANEDPMNLTLTNQDDRNYFSTLTHSSEAIQVIEVDEDYIELIYFNYENSSNLYYSTGLFNMIRLDVTDFYGGSESEQDVEKLDNTAITQSSRNYHTKTLSLSFVPEQMMRKLTEAFSHKEIFLNRIQYSVDGGVEPEKIEGTNSYAMEVNFVSAEPYFNPLLNRDYCGDRLINDPYRADTIYFDYRARVEGLGGVLSSNECTKEYIESLLND